ncbi:DUF5107 domain-containing protein [Streptosporangium sp. CA-135522]|uniref:DUF5107 domain-containing protein n=1 Tax=Streptosporangium sp. CA-135522 TaxID=3240072 RepID=UPI003D9319C9
MPDVAEEYGRPFSLLPYGKRDRYGRDPVERDIPVIVLENEHLRASFLPSLGGRLWSLIDKARERELLYRNPVIQPANLALRDAWFAGGVEWNLGTTGHWALTCDPLHAARVEAPVPVLRMYEYERMRGLILQIDAWLPPGSRVLLIDVTLRNPQPHEVPVYWWSNIAVPQTPSTRVLAPASRAEHFDYTGKLTTVPYPGSPDVSYPARWHHAADYFLHLSGTPWIAAVDGDGYGLLQASTGRLAGRKLFGWGTGPGGSRWQEWLARPGHRYLEIQAGLARTQFQHLSMPAGTRWSWTEAYGPLSLDNAHGSHDEARTAVAGALATPAEPGRWADHPVAETLHSGSGWGALERRAGALPAIPATPFPDETLGDEQHAWLALLETGELAESAVCVIGPHWLRLLERASGWQGRYHLGLARWATGDVAGARRAWKESLGERRSPLALRALAEAHRIAGDDAAAAVLLLEAHALAPALLALTVETLKALIDAGRPERALALIDDLAGRTGRAHGRILLLEAQAALGAGDRERAGRILDEGLVVPDLREGEDALDELWSAHHGDTSGLPAHYDFRMG